MMTKLLLCAALSAAGAPVARDEDLDDTRMIDFRSSRKAACKRGPMTWMACGRSDAFAAMRAARRLRLHPGQDVRPVGNGAAKPGGPHRCCSLVVGRALEEWCPSRTGATISSTTTTGPRFSAPSTSGWRMPVDRLEVATEAGLI